MGIVWRAHDQLPDRKVTVKEVLLDAAIDEYEMADRHERMQREAQTAARLLSAPILGTAGALWQFDFGQSKATMMRVDILLFTWRRQSYTIKMTSLAGTNDSYWNKKILATMTSMLHTSTPLPS